MGKYNPDTDTVWSTTGSGYIAHAFDSEGRALCRRNIRPRPYTTMNDKWGTRANYENLAHTSIHDRCAQKLDAAKAAKAPSAPALYRPVHSRRGAGHYRRPGTASSYCGRTVEAAPVGAQSVNGVCQQCAKAEQRDRVAAEQIAADRSVDGPTLAQRAGVRYALVGKGRRAHYSPNNDDTLCGREVTKYTDGLDKRHPELCARCITAAEERAYGRALAAASPIAAAAERLAETVEQADAEQAATSTGESARVPGTLVDPWTWIRRETSSNAARRAAQAAEERAERRQHLADSRGANAYPLAVAAVRQVVHEMARGGALRVHVTEGSPDAYLSRDDLHALAYSGHTTADAVARVRVAVAAHIHHGARDVHEMSPALGMRPALYLPDVMALLNRWDAAQVATEAEAEAGTWRGKWIGEQPTNALFNVEQDEQGALFNERATTPTAVKAERSDVVAPEATRASVDAYLAREYPLLFGQGNRVERSTVLATTSEQQHDAHATERRVMEGVVVSHAGTAQGSTPSNASNPDVIAAREALAGLAVATLTDDHDVTEPTEAERKTRGYYVDPRTHGRVAVYWLEEGQIVRRDQRPNGPVLERLADRLKRRGGVVEKMLRSSLCVFAHRPAEGTTPATVAPAAPECLHRITVRPDVSGDPIKACARTQATQDAGVFNDEGCVEAYDCVVEAANRAAEWNAAEGSDADDPLYRWALMCVDHRDSEQQADTCEECYAEEA
ncbi:hypothetical protein ACWEV4_02485 [Streptomyces sp. NPDC003860]